MKQYFLTLIAILSLTGAAKSTIVLSNLGNVGDEGSFSSIAEAGVWRAQSFVTSSGDWTLNDATLRIKGNNAWYIGVGIFANSTTDPYAPQFPGSGETGILEFLTGPDTGGTDFVDATYTSTGLSLAGDTRYWIVLLAVPKDGEGPVIWSNANGNSPSTAIWSIPADSNVYSLNSGESWAVDAAASSNIQNFGINATGSGPEPVPEPGTWAAAALLAGGAGFMRWRKRRSVRVFVAQG